MTETTTVLTPQPTQLSLPQILMEAPGRIRKARQDLFEGRVAVDRLRLEVKLLEARHLSQVSAATGADGKKLHTNAESREAAVRDRMSEDPGALDLKRQVDERVTLNAKVEAYIEYWEDLQRSARVLMLARSPFDAVMAVEDI